MLITIEMNNVYLQVVCSQAVSIACTQDLNASMTGFLPVNCVMQLLKAKSFSKYNIPLKVYNNLPRFSNYQYIYKYLGMVV